MSHKVFLDADVIHKLYLRTLLMSLDRAGMLNIRWSNAVLKEAGVSIERRLGVKEGTIQSKLFAYSKAFPRSRVRNYGHLLGTLDCPDPNDEHVLAAAIVSRSSFLLTFNTKDYPDDSEKKHGVTVINPDQFLIEVLPRDVKTFHMTVATWLSYFDNPVMSVSEGAVALRVAGCPKIAAWMELNAPTLEELRG